MDNQEYRPGQVFSLNTQELLELQPERKAPLPSTPQLQQLYSQPQPDPRQNLQQIYFLEPHGARQVGDVPDGLVQVTSPARNALPTNNPQSHQMYNTAQPSIPNALLNRSQIPQLNTTAQSDPNSQRILHELQADIHHQLQQLYYIKPRDGTLVLDRLEGIFEIVPAWKTAPTMSTTAAPTSTTSPPKTAAPTTVEQVTIAPQSVTAVNSSPQLQEITKLEPKPFVPLVSDKEQASNTTQVHYLNSI